MISDRLFFRFFTSLNGDLSYTDYDCNEVFDHFFTPKDYNADIRLYIDIYPSMNKLNHLYSAEIASVSQSWNYGDDKESSLRLSICKQTDCGSF